MSSRCHMPVLVEFQSTHPVRGATSMLYWVIGSLIFQSTHPVRGATSMKSPIL